MNFKHRQKNTIVIVFLLALLLRLSYVVLLPQLEGKELADVWAYDSLALSLASGEGYPEDLRRPPLFPLFLAGVYKLFGHNFFIVRLIQAVIGSLTCLLVYLIGKKVFNETIGFIAALLAIFYPGFISYTGLVLAETLAAFLMSSSIYFLIKAASYQNRWGWYALAGIVLGLTVLCRPEMLLFPFLVLLGLLSIYKSKKQALIGFFILLGLMSIVISPWTVRNYRLVHKFIPVTVGFGANLWLGSHPEDLTEWYSDKEPIKSLVDKTQIEFNAKLRKLAFKNITARPFIYLKLCIKKFFRFWLTSHSNTFKGLEESFVSTIQSRNYKIFFQKAIFFAINMGLILLGFFGIFLARKRWKAAFLLLSIIIYKVFLHMLLYSAPRYQIPIMPFMLVFTAVALERCLQKTKFLLKKPIFGCR